MAHPLRDRNFRVLFAGRVVDALGDAVSPAALTLAIVIATRSSAGLALVLVCALLPRVTLLPLGGVVVDRLGPRRVAMAAAVVSGAAQLFIGLLLLAGHIDFPLIAVAAAVKGAASGFDTPATLPLVAGTTDGDGRQAANALMGIASSATSLAGRTKVSRAVLVGNFALMSYAVPLILFAIAAPAWAVVISYGLAVACLGFLNPVWETAVQQEVPPEVLAREVVPVRGVPVDRPGHHPPDARVRANLLESTF